MASLSEQDWDIRLSIYQHFVEHGTPPTFSQTARHFVISDQAAREAYHRLNAGHAIFLEPGTDMIRMANPLSAVPTACQVQVNGKRLYANCAWDSLGIPAMLKIDVHIQATLPDSTETIAYAITDGELSADSGLVVHFPLPFGRWYDDLVDT